MDNQLGLLGHVSCLSMQVGLFSHFCHCQFGIDFARIDFLEINLSRPQHCSEKTLPLGCHPRKNWTYLKNVRIIMPSACVNKMSWDYQWLSTTVQICTFGAVLGCGVNPPIFRGAKDQTAAFALMWCAKSAKLPHPEILIQCHTCDKYILQYIYIICI